MDRKKIIMAMSVSVLMPLSASALSALPSNRQLQPTFTEWHDLQINEVNRYPMHAHFFTYESDAKALKGHMSASSYY